MADELNKLSIKLAYVSVNKKIVPKFFLQNAENNVPSGTVIKETVTNAFRPEFFMCSATTTAGTANPVRYQLLTENMNLNERALIQLTYVLCHAYYNWFGRYVQ